MKMQLFIVTYRKDFPYLIWCLRSMRKFCSGFSGLTLLVPDEDVEDAKQLVTPDPWVSVRGYTEWPKQGMLHHMYQILHADQWTDADLIAHLDADCIFTAPVTPETYAPGGKPFLRWEYFSKLGKRHPGAAQWQEPTQRCLPFVVIKETMRCHPGVFHNGLYPEARAQMERQTRMSCEQYIRQQRNEFPQTWCEFNTLGNVALHVFPNRYQAVEQTNDVVTPDNCLQQFWSHGAIDKPQRVWVKGEEKEIIPLHYIFETLQIS